MLWKKVVVSVVYWRGAVLVREGMGFKKRVVRGVGWRGLGIRRVWMGGVRAIALVLRCWCWHELEDALQVYV